MTGEVRLPKRTWMRWCRPSSASDKMAYSPRAGTVARIEVRGRAVLARTDEGTRLVVDDQLEQRPGAAITDYDDDGLVRVVGQPGLDAQTDDVGGQVQVEERDEDEENGWHRRKGVARIEAYHARPRSTRAPVRRPRRQRRRCARLRRRRRRAAAASQLRRRPVAVVDGQERGRVRHHVPRDRSSVPDDEHDDRARSASSPSRACAASAGNTTACPKATTSSSSTPSTPPAI